MAKLRVLEEMWEMCEECLDASSVSQRYMDKHNLHIYGHSHGKYGHLSLKYTRMYITVRKFMGQDVDVNIILETFPLEL